MARELVNTFSVEPFTNEIGQTLNPGDKVVFVATGRRHKVSVFEGVFEGVYRGNLYNKGKITGTRIGQVPVNWNERVYSEDGEHEEVRYDWRTYQPVATGRRYNLIPKTRYRKSSLQRNRVFKIDTSLAKVKI